MFLQNLKIEFAHLWDQVKLKRIFLEKKSWFSFLSVDLTFLRTSENWIEKLKGKILQIRLIEPLGGREYNGTVSESKENNTKCHGIGSNRNRCDKVTPLQNSTPEVGEGTG